MRRGDGATWAATLHRERRARWFASDCSGTVRDGVAVPAARSGATFGDAMLTFVLKLVLTPTFIALATLLARRWGPAVGGTIAGLPLTSTPVSIFLAIEQGRAFAATAAVGTLLGLLSQAAVCLAYSWTARRARWPVSVAVGVSAFIVMTLILERVSLSLGVAFILVCALLAAAGALIVVPPVALARTRVPAWDLPIRMLVATTVVVVLTAIAATVGPRWTGLLSPF